MINENNQNIDNNLISKYRELITEMIDFEQGFTKTHYERNL